MLFTELLCAAAFIAELEIAGWRLIIKNLSRLTAAEVDPAIRYAYSV